MGSYFLNLYTGVKNRSLADYIPRNFCAQPDRPIAALGGRPKNTSSKLRKQTTINITSNIFNFVRHGVVRVSICYIAILIVGGEKKKNVEASPQRIY